ncbi:Rqc2 family fibronectin-binding protein [Phorcysia thermohydrogeniphila]|uniref:Putative ribosome quality control (RQC) complex YloA/Tae2 family protein n=1 Tax=Phorcysia thermohydrogeniphila TaxID=936138 RepID=A0A4R1GKJ6_9BACT|nr:NFACT family protein [Phorcysia thermohydrogeniphila]TCK06569.1 putative ribosome quality control (RQC) complex YloA/Tae2 family protein [Phorcysia thermohydrogeniphila]
MDYLFIEKCVPEIEKALRKERISAVYGNQKTFSIKAGKFFLNVYTGQPNALFLSQSPLSQDSLKNFKPLEGTYVKSVKLPVKDRVIEIETVKLSLSGKVQTYYLILELTGKNANVLLLDSNRKIIALLRPFKSSVRPFEVGDEYQYPPLDKKEFSELKFGKVTPEGIEKNLHKVVAGISPLNAKEIALLFKETGSLEKAYATFLEKHKNSKTPCLYLKDRKPKFMTTFPYLSLKELERREFSGEFPFTECWKAYFEEKVEAEELERLKERILSDLEEKERALLTELSELSSPEELRERAEEKKLLGELLKYNLHLLKPGMERVKVTDYVSGKEVVIPVNPTISPKGNVEEYFKQYRKLLRKAEHSKKRKKEIEEELETISLLKGVVRDATQKEELDTFLPAKKEEKREKKKLKIFRLPSGNRIVVGRNSRENEFITFRLANEHDLWFHVKDTPGSHVILRLESGKEPSDEDILLAASAAVFFSKAKSSGKVPVDFTEAKNLKKPKGTPPGFVTYSGEKTVYASSELFEKFLNNPEKPSKG